MLTIVLTLYAVGVVPKFSNLDVPDPVRFQGFLQNNVASGSKMPLSYMPWPRDYFNNVPDVLKLKQFTEGTYIYLCKGSSTAPGGLVNATAMNAYTFQTEQLISSLGLDIYDGSVWGIASGILGNFDNTEAYYRNILLEARTAQLGDIKGHAPCKGDLSTGACVDPTQNGACGICYGDEMESLSKQNALLFRLVADFWAVQGTVDARCPDLKHLWTWNDYKPILGENAWALVLGPLNTAVRRLNGSISQIPEDAPEFQLAINAVPAFRSLKVPITDVTKPGHGAVYYAPNNVFYYAGSPNPDAGATVSVENQASLHAGLMALRHVLAYKPKYNELRCEVEDMISGLESFLLSAWNGVFFRQGGTHNKTTGVWSWGQANSPDFAVDCQTWVATTLGPRKIDAHLGPNTTKNLWETLKNLSGYGLQANGSAKGVGYTTITTPKYIANSSVEASPTVGVYVTTPVEDFNKKDFLDKVAYISGESMEYIVILNVTAAPLGGSVAYIVFLRQGNEPAVNVAKGFSNQINTNKQAAGYVNATKALIEEVFSAEWTLGAVNLARVIANESGYDENTVQKIIADADFMRSSIERELLTSTPTQNTFADHPSLLYANTRSWIPFGWWANSIPSLASTSWGVAVDSSVNPLNLFGHYTSQYPVVNPVPVQCGGAFPPSPTAPPLPPPTPLPPGQHEILEVLYQSTGGPNWVASDNWLSGLEYQPCGAPAPVGSPSPYQDPWAGVTCDANGHIIGLDLSNNNLLGTLPDALGGLTRLEVLRLSENSISGTFPDSLAGVGSLQQIQLSHNAISGAVPSLDGLKGLRYLWLSENSFSSIPDFSSLRNLSVLNVNKNKLTSLPLHTPYNTYPNCDLSQNPFLCPIPQAAETNCYAVCM